MLRQLPSVVSRGLLYLIVAFVATAFVWAAVNKIDIIVEVPATVVPRGKLRVIEPSDHVVIREILVRVGDRVSVGQPLLIVESPQVSNLLTELQQRRSELTLAVREVEEFTPMKIDDFENQLAAERDVFALRRQLHDETLLKLAGSAERKAYELQMAQSRLKLADRTVRVETILHEKGRVAERKLLESKQLQEELQAVVATLESELLETDTDEAIEIRQFAVEQREHQRRVIELQSQIAELRQAADKRLTEARIWYDKAHALASLNINGADASLVQRAARGEVPATNLRTLAAPVAGVVASVQVNTPGETAARGETLVELIPDGVSLEAELKIPNRNVGKAKVGQKVRFKFDAFPFAQHGVLTGRIRSISPSALPGEAGTQQPYYRAQADLGQDYFRVNGETVPLLPGMTATAEITTDNRRVLAVIFEPLRELTEPRRPRSRAMSSEVATLLRAQALFSGMEDRDIEELAGRGTMQALPMGRTIFREGDEGDTAYLVYSGRVRVLTGTNGHEVTLGTLARGDFLGERAALTGEPRMASARVAEDAVVIGFDSAAFRDVCASQPQLQAYFDRLAANRSLISFLRVNTFLGALPPKLVQPFIERLEEHRYTAGEVIFREGDPSDRLYIVAEGQVKILRGHNSHERVLAHYDEGDFFGERALILNEARFGTAVATSDVRCLTIGRTDFQALLEASPRARAELEARIRTYDGVTAASSRRPVAGEPIAAPRRVLDYAEPSPEAPPQDEQATRRRDRRRSRPLRYPWVRQHDETDCGAASLAMIARYHGKRLPIAHLRDLANVGREGASLFGVATAAEKVGFATRALRTDYHQLARLELPAIVHWAGYHYIVLYEVSEKRVVVGDPAIGLLRIPRAEFEDKWTGRLLQLTPTEKLDEQDEQRTTLRRFLPLLQPHRMILAEVFLASLAINLFGLASPLFTQTIIDKVLVHQDVRMLNLMLGGMLIVGVFSTLTVLLRYNLLIHIGQKIGVRMSSDLFRQILRLAMPYFDKRKVGDVLTRFGDNAEVRQLITGDAIETMLDMIMVVVYLSLMFVYDPGLTAVALVFIPVSVIATLVITPMIKRNNQKLFEKIAASESKLIETIKNVTVIKAAAAELPVRWKYEDLIVQNANQQWQSARLGMALHGISSAVQILSSMVVLWYGALLVMDGVLTVGQLVAFIALYGMVMAPVLGLVGMWQQLQEALLSLERLSDIYDSPPEQPAAAETIVDLPDVRGHIQFENVSFGYSEESENVLSNINLEVQPGQVLALVGRSGSGKSTLISLLQRLYAPTKGRILIDGSNIASVSTSSLRRQMGICLQDTPLFTGTIRENISIGDPEISMEQVIAAARLANAHGFITAFPLGYDTLVGESGIRLSGGQRQRIAIARALLREPPILVFDEATSSLDAESERAIQDNLAEILKDRTAIIIAHRLSTIRDADLIAVLDRGMLVESGSHAELMARRGLYHYLVSQQLSE